MNKSNANVNLLIVDDTLKNIQVLGTLLRNEGYQIHVAQNGLQALKVVETVQPDLILLDVMMPQLDGFETCKRLKANEKTKEIPIIFLTARTEIEAIVEGFELGAVDYVTKPFNPPELLSRVNTHLTLYKLQKELEQRVADRTAELRQTNRAYSRFVPRAFLQLLNQQSIVDVTLGDYIQTDMTILFSDIRDFTPLSERMPPPENFRFINEYLSRVSPIIRQYDGFIDKYMGDGIMALFPEQPENALQAAIAMQREVAHFNTQLSEKGKSPIRIGIGLHTGKLMLGTIGETERMEGTVISDAVNVAARIEGLTKLYQANVLISESTLTQLKHAENYNFRCLGKVQVKGRREPVSVYEVLDGSSTTSIALKLKTKAVFEAGLDLLLNRRFAEASVKFNSILEHNPGDKAARVYLERSEQLMVQRVPPDLEGAEVVIEK